MESITQATMETFNQAVHLYAKVGLRPDEKTLVEKHFPKYGRVLVVGCGAGRSVFPLEEMGYEVIGVDISPRMIEEANRMKEERGSCATFIVMDAFDLAARNWQGKFDVIFFPFHSLDYVYPFSHREFVLHMVKCLLNPKGVLVYSMHNRLFPRNWWAWKKNHEGAYASIPSQEGSIVTYVNTPWSELELLSKIFPHSWAYPRYALIPEGEKMHWKERLMRKLSPWSDKSFYFIAYG